MTGRGVRYAQAMCLLLILVIGMGLRLGTAAGTQVDHPVRNDAKEYVAYAWNAKFMGTYSPDFSTLLGTSTAPPVPDAVRPPGYPMLLRAFMPQYLDTAFFSKMAFVQAWLSGLTLLAVTLMAIALLGAWPGLAVGALVALSPHQSVYIPYLLSETFFGTALMLALAAGAWALKADGARARYSLAFLSGLMFGLSCLIRPTLNQWVPVLLVLLLVPAVRHFWRHIAALTIGFVLIMSPWWVRNEITLHRLTDSEKMLATIQQGGYVNLMYQNRPETYGLAYRFDPRAAKASSSWPNLISDLREKFASQPLAMIHWYLTGKVVTFFSWSSAEGWGGIFTYAVLSSPWLTNPTNTVIASLMKCLHAPLILFGLLGTFMAFLPNVRRLFGVATTNALRFIALLHAFAIGVHVVGLPISRYSVPFQPLSFLLAVFALVWAARLYQEHRKQTLLGGSAHA